MDYTSNKSRTNMFLRTSKILRATFCATALYIATSMAEAAGPITPSGLNTQVNLSATPSAGTVQHDLTGGTRVGTNLFHSFGEFSVPTNNIANFLNDSGLTTSNVLGRVTGGNPSNILGMIQTTGFGNANLFLMNPSGIVFGPNASLNVGGSVAFTTANYLRLAEINGKAGVFHADSALPSVLTSAPVSTFGFLGSGPAAIAVQESMLTTQPGQSISLIGGNITVESSTLANNKGQPAQPNTSAGRINLASVAFAGEIAAETLDYASNINDQPFGALGTIQVSNKSVIDASGNGGGTVRIRSGQFVLDDSKISANVTGPGTVSNGVESIGGGIDIVVSQDAAIQKGAVVEINVASDASPGVTYGGVQVKADRIMFLGIPGSPVDFNNLRFTSITTNTEGAGNAGNITLYATGNMDLTNVVSLASTSGFNADGTAPSPTVARGNAGNVALTSTRGDILMRNGGRATQVTSQLLNSSGNTGNVTLSALDGNIILDGVSVFTASFDEGGQVGSIKVTAKDLLMNAGLLSNESIGPFKPGGITVALSGNLRMAADFSLQPRVLPISLIVTSAFSPTGTPAADINITTKNVVITQGSLISSETYGSGPGGQLNITSDTLQIMGGSRLASGSTFAPPFGSLPPGIIPTGKGGDITIRSLRGPTSSVLIDGLGSGIFSDTVGNGAGGSIDLSARSLTIQHGGTISASTTGSDLRATGGSVVVNTTDQVSLTDDASITASSTGPANAGNISIDAGQQLNIENSKITTEANQAKAGNISIRAIDEVRVVNGEISTSVHSGAGRGGDITIDPKTVILQDDSRIFAQAVQGSGGNITITTPLYLKDATSFVNADSQFGLNGSVTIQSPTSNLSGTVGQLASKTSPPQVLLQNRCIALAGGQQSTFILAGREALPAEPGGWLSSPVAMEHWTGQGTDDHAAGLLVQRKNPNGFPVMVALQHETHVLSLRRLTPPGFLVRTFATGTTGCPS